MKKLALTVSAALAALALVLYAWPAAALGSVDTTAFRAAVTTDAMLGHERAFQAIADRDGGTRATGTKGYDDSVAYVASTLRGAGYKVTLQSVELPFFRELAPATVTEVSPTRSVMATTTFRNSGSGDVTGPVVVAGGTAVSPVAQRTASGCDAKTFGAAPSADAVALVEVGTCSFTVQAANAKAAGYAAVIIFNFGGSSVSEGSLDAPVSIPVVGLTFTNGSRLAVAAKAGPTTVHVTASTEADAHRKASSVLADTPKGKTGETVVVGGHLDSALGSPGLNDNGSGNAAVLEVAVQLAKQGYLKKGRLQRQIRFAFWAGGLNGQLGSRHYVASLSQSARDTIYAELDYRALASKSHYVFVYDGDGSATGDKGPAGSAPLNGLGLVAVPNDWGGEALGMVGQSDYAAFTAEGIPSGGADTDGFGTIRDPRQNGGVGEPDDPFDPCYHKACDTISNVDPVALGVMGDYVAHATLTLAVSRTGIFPDGS